MTQTHKNGTVIIGSGFITITAVGVNNTSALLMQAHNEQLVYQDLRECFLVQVWSSDYNDGASVTGGR